MAGDIGGGKKSNQVAASGPHDYGKSGGASGENGKAGDAFEQVGGYDSNSSDAAERHGDEEYTESLAGDGDG